MLAAAARAAHLFRHGHRAVLSDWLAWPFLGRDAETILETGRVLLGENGDAFATWIAARSRITEDWLQASAARRYLILGAGLDSFAWRSEGAVEVLEIDHPSTQAWKQSRFAALGLASPSHLTFVPVDFERQELAIALHEMGGLDDETFVSWIGVTPYLTNEAIVTTLNALRPCVLAVSYVPPEAVWDRTARSIAERMTTAVAGVGEPWVSFYSPSDFADLLSTAGFRVFEDLGPEDVERRFGLSCVNYERIALAR
jgi:methyltransferase (TIGR00027 family)